MNQPDKTAIALEKIMDIALEYSDNPVSVIGLLECAKSEVHELMKKRKPTYEGFVN